METVYDSDQLPESERAEAWAEATAASLVPSRMRIPEQGVFGARLQTIALGEAQLSAMSYTALNSCRTPALIKLSDPGHYQIALVRSGQQGIEQARRRSLLTAGTLVFYDSSRPFEAVVPSSLPRAESLLLQFPKSLLPLPERQARQLLAAPIDGRAGMGRLLTEFLSTVAADGSAYTAQDRCRLQNIAIHLTAATLAHQAGRPDDQPQESRQEILFLQITSYIERHLAAPDLGPERIAAAHHISRRHLHRIFQRQHTTVAGTIRQLRLERCRRDLADPARRGLTVHAIAARWGFPEPAAFSRIFRAAVGCSPTEFRAARSADAPRSPQS